MNLGKLSPQARKAMRQSGDASRVRATVELAPGRTPENLVLPSSDGTVEVVSWSPRSHLMTVLIDPTKLAALAGESAVSYVEVGGRMRV